MIDVWQGYNQGVQSLGNALDDQQKMAAQKLQMQLTNQQIEGNQLALDKNRRATADEQLLREKLAALKPISQTTYISDVDTSTPDYSAYTGESTPAMQALTADLTTAPQQKYSLLPNKNDYAGLEQNVNANPSFAKLSGAAARLADMKAATAMTPETTTENPLQSVGTRLETDPTLDNYIPEPQVTKTTVTVPKSVMQQRFAILEDHAMKTGEYDPLTKAVNLDVVLSIYKAEQEMGGGDMTTYVKGQLELNAGKDLIATISPLMTKGEAGRKLAANYLAAAKQAQPNNDIFKNATLDDFTSNQNGPAMKIRDENNQTLGHYILNPQKGEMEYHASNSAQTAHNTHTIKYKDGTARDFQYNPQTEKYDIPLGDVYKPTSQQRLEISNGTTGNSDQISSWYTMLKTGNAVLSDIPARGNIRTQVIDYIAKNDPTIDLAKLKANKKWTESAGTAQTLALVDATKQIVADMETEYKKLDRTSIPGLNAAQDVWQKWSGNEDRQRYMTLKNYGIQEVEKMLSGSGQMSDHRVKLAFESLQNSNTPGQFRAAVEGIQKVMAERERATRQGPYPEVKNNQSGVKSGRFTVQVVQ